MATQRVICSSEGYTACILRRSHSECPTCVSKMRQLRWRMQPSNATSRGPSLRNETQLQSWTDNINVFWGRKCQMVTEAMSIWMKKRHFILTFIVPSGICWSYILEYKDAQCHSHYVYRPQTMTHWCRKNMQIRTLAQG